LKIESKEIEKPNEIEDNIEIEKKNNHEVEFNQREIELEYEIITFKIESEQANRI
jgi:hypothetical protein